MDYLSKHHVILDGEKNRIGIVFSTKRINVGLIAGLSCGGLALLVAVVILVVVCVRRKSKQNRNKALIKIPLTNTNSKDSNYK